MKKRRELDALVGGVKSRRKNSSSGHELLRCNGSESSDDDFRVDSHKTKGAGLCSTCTSVLVFLLLVACLLVTAGLAWMHVDMRKDLETLRMNLHTVESREKGDLEDLQKLQQQVIAFSETLQYQNTTLKAVIANISSVNTTLAQLTVKMEKLSDSIAAAPELKDLPAKITAVSQSVASLGSDVGGWKDTVNKVEPFIKATNSRLHDLTAQMNNISKAPVTPLEAPDTGLSPELSNTIQSLTKRVDDVNSTLSVKVALLMKSYTQHEERLSHLEDSTEVLSKNLSSLVSDHSTITSEHSSMTGDQSTQGVDLESEQFKTAVTNIVNNVVSGDSVSAGQGELQVLRENITDLAVGLKSLQDKYNSLKPGSTGTDQPEGQFDEDAFVSQEMFNTMGDNFMLQIQGLNGTVLNLKSDVLSLSGKIVQQTNTVTNLTHHVDAMATFISILQQQIQQTGSNNSPNSQVTTVPPLADNPDNVLPAKSDQSQTQAPPEPETVQTQAPPSGDQDSTPKPNSESPSDDTIPVTTVKTAHAPYIKTQDDFDLNFRRWDRTGTGQIRYGELDGYLGPYLPERAFLDTFDADHNGLFSYEELAKAFGFKATTESPVSDEPPPPR